MHHIIIVMSGRRQRIVPMRRFTYLLFNFLQLAALFADVVQQLQGLVILSGDLHTCLLQASLQALQTHMCTQTQGCCSFKSILIFEVSRTATKPMWKTTHSFTFCTHADRVVIMTHTALSNVGGEVLLQDAPLSLRRLKLHILLVEHWLQVSHFTLEPGDLLLHLDPESIQQLVYMQS